MKYLLMVLSVIAVVYSQEEDQNVLTTELNGLLDDITNLLKNISKSLPNNNTIGDVSNFFKSKQVSKRDVSLDSNLSTMKAELKRKCNIYGLPEDYPSVEVAIEQFDSCINGVANRIQTEKINGLDRTTNVECRYGSELNICFVNYTNALQPCLPRFKGGRFPFSNISQAVINYLCNDQGSQERTKLFMDTGITCIYEKMETLDDCLNSSFPSGTYPNIEENAYLFSEENCRKLFELKKCVKAELQQCSTSVVSFLEGLNSAVERFYTPCPQDRKPEEVNIV